MRLALVLLVGFAGGCAPECDPGFFTRNSLNTHQVGRNPVRRKWRRALGIEWLRLLQGD